jgi:hypothetical protein
MLKLTLIHSVMGATDRCMGATVASSKKSRVGCMGATLLSKRKHLT